MREREAARLVRRYVARNLPQYATCRLDVTLEQDGERRRSWAFGLHIDEEDPDYGDADPVGYVHADDGHIEGPYGVNRAALDSKGGA
jgi:hypothetical protein